MTNEEFELRCNEILKESLEIRKRVMKETRPKPKYNEHKNEHKVVIKDLGLRPYGYKGSFDGEEIEFPTEKEFDEYCASLK